MNTTKDEIIYLRSHLLKGEQKEIANTVGVSHGYVRCILAGYFNPNTPAAQDVIRIVENRVYTRFEQILDEHLPLFRFRPDLVEHFKNRLDSFN